MADVIGRWHRLLGDEVFFLTGTDEHAAKVVDAAAEQGVPPLAWADRNAAIFQQTFTAVGITYDDFIRTTQRRHTERVQEYLAVLLEHGAVYRGRYEGWYDAGQEEYVPESRAAALAFRSPISGRPLVRKAEDNYFFRLSTYSTILLRLLEDQPDFVQPDSRRKEVLGRLHEGLHDIPISRTGTDWGVSIPGDPLHKVYVWIDALFGYVSAIDTPVRRPFWPANVHLIAKDILWFHAVVWPALLLALRETPWYRWLALPRQIYSHSFWVSGGLKMSKSLGNAIDLERLQHYVERVGRDGPRYFLATNGPLSTADRDFSEVRLDDVYLSDLANGFGNLVQRVTALVSRYTEACVPEPGQLHRPEEVLRAAADELPRQVADAFSRFAIDEAVATVTGFVTLANRYAEETAPWQQARAGNTDGVRTALYHLVEAARLAAWYLWPVIPEAAAEAHRRLSGQHPTCGLGEFGVVRPGDQVTTGQPLFPRLQQP